MRELKFRQPIFREGKFESWHYWGYTEGGFVSPANADLERLSQQFTGLKDKTGKEIYEGDFLKNPRTDYILDVKYGGLIENNQGACYGYSFPYHINLNEIEVIGNIYENKEKLK